MDISQTVNQALLLSKQALDMLKEGGSVRKEINIVIDNAFNTMIKTVQGFIDYVLKYVENDFATC